MKDAFRTAEDVRRENETAILAEIVRSPRVDGMIDAYARRASYRAYGGGTRSDGHRIALHALSRFLGSGDSREAILSIRTSQNEPMLKALAMEHMRSHGYVGELAAAMCAELGKSGRGCMIDLALAEKTAAGALSARISDLDDSVPLDVADGADAIVCFLPGYGRGVSIMDLQTDCLGKYTTMTSIRPDAAFERLLRLVNVSSDDYRRLTLATHGIDPIEVDPAWATFDVPADASRPPVIDVGRLADGIDGSPYGFVPMLAFKASVRFLIERDWTVPLRVTGGIVGFHNTQNGSGNPQRFEEEIEIRANPRSLIVGEGFKHDFGETYGYTRDSFRSMVADSAPVAPERGFMS